MVLSRCVRRSITGFGALLVVICGPALAHASGDWSLSSWHILVHDEPGVGDGAYEMFRHSRTIDAADPWSADVAPVAAPQPHTRFETRFHRAREIDVTDPWASKVFSSIAE